MNTFNDPTNNIFVTSNPLIGDTLAIELQQLGFKPGKAVATGVPLKGSMADAYTLNMELTTANKVLVELFSFKARRLDDVYQNCVKYPWDLLLKNEELLSIHSVVRNDTIRDHRVVNLKLKDAIVDRMKKVFGKRPDSGPDFSGAVIFCLWRKDDCRVFLDTSGQTISKHGYRKIPHKAPLQEALASALILNTRWNHEQPFVNPMCGSGTLAIEAALLATSRKPGLLRRDYGFMHVRGFNDAQFKESRKKLREQVKEAKPVIIASDRDPRALKAARFNAKAAGVENLIRFELGDFRDTTIPDGPGVIIMNPEYGERLGEVEVLEKTYAHIGDFLKQKCQGYTGYVFTGNLDLAKKIGLRTSRRTPFLNGKIDCRLLEYQLYSGSKKRVNDNSGIKD